MQTTTRAFQTILSTYYATHGRHELPWRISGPDGQFDAYKILVSELMLQQTQVGRVIPKFHAFLDRFPTVDALAAAPFGDVLIAWSGLGYNRRAKFLWQAAQQIANQYQGVFPDTFEGLVSLPGVGKNTAGAILAYAFNQPALFIETNVRTVYIHHFFADEPSVSDAQISALLATTINKAEPRIFYWSLMDYGTHLKQTVGNLNQRSRHYAKQSPLEGSRRQIRGQIIRLLTNGPQTLDQVLQILPDGRTEGVLQDLLTETMIIYDGEQYALH